MQYSDSTNIFFLIDMNIRHNTGVKYLDFTYYSKHFQMPTEFKLKSRSKERIQCKE